MYFKKYNSSESSVKGNLYNVRNFVEKQAIDKALSDLAIIGYYLLTPEIFDILAKTTPDRGEEVQLTDAIDILNKTQRVFAHVFNMMLVTRKAILKPRLSMA